MSATIGVLGTGWRAEYFLRIASLLPERFTVAGILTRSEESAERAAARWAVPTTTDWDEFVGQAEYDWVVVSVPWDAAPVLTRRFVERGTPVLCETPPAPDLDGLRQLWADLGPDAPVQVAEQYVHQPHHAARIAVARSGLLGRIGHATFSSAHGYHGVSLLRAALGVGFDPVSVTAMNFDDPVLKVRGRDDWPDEIESAVALRVIATLRWGDRIGIHDFNGEQYTSPIRRRHVHLTGERGELFDDEVVHVVGPGQVAHGRLHREQAGVDGDLEGHFLRSITLGERVVYRSEFGRARLNDDELAVARVMAGMDEFVRTGTPIYPLADACHDHYLNELMDRARKGGGKVVSEPQPWGDQRSLFDQDSSH
ncbi:Gfo/Idh/MocA family protein [Aestuariimicrobium ganziense]|uniref:Gfo/Idh/MocA family protein n=1 Tax=Aestuariimicrobium ganziense TaxID=2773677 RepID=UPI0019405A52|nr:Gfo/Idh/MocA family oxidoreductase [Aestuariimicrobium ganziense]